MKNTDDIYKTPSAEPGNFVFDEKVARVFPDMVRRSVPGYASVMAGSGLIAAEYVQPGSRCYDLGCSVGASTFAMLEHIRRDDYEIISVDNSRSMIDQCQANISASDHAKRVSCICADILDTEISNASVVILNYTLQFVPPELRASLLKNINCGMNPGGVLVLSEKLSFSNNAEQQRQTRLHEAFKRVQGYSELEIARKRAALENVLIPETLDTHLQRLEATGFQEAQLWFRSINFASMMAWK
jgi:tRNA (cmo5U34)-methyltransferase